MQKTVISVAVLLCLSAFVLGASADGNNKQSGDNSDCADYNALYLAGGVFSPLAAHVDVTGDADYNIDVSSGHAYIDFYDAGGFSAGYGGPSGSVPSNAVSGTICVATEAGYPVVPEPLATWTYSE